MLVKQKIKGDLFVKEYPLYFFINPEETYSRCQLIEKYTQENKHALHTWFTFENTKITRYTKQNKTLKHVSNQYLLDNAQLLRDIVNNIHELGLVHGDLNKKNILKDSQNNLIITDFEPGLELIINTQLVLMVSNNNIDEYDKINKKITEKTDHYCLNKLIS